jgi:uncharacterized membrane protein YhaH (DUF805 family)
VATPQAAPRRTPLLWLFLSLKGRISRPIYWASYFGLLSLNFVLYFQLIGTTEEAFSAGLMVYFLLAGVAILYANIAIAVKRLHDIGYGGFLAVAIVIPVVNLAFNIWVGVLPGTPDANRFGDAADRPPS